MKLKYVVLAIYVVLVGQFLVANLVYPFGPHYTIHTAAYDLDYKNYILEQTQFDCRSANPTSCIINCPAITGAMPTTIEMGFPFTDYETYPDVCATTSPFPESDFALAIILNILYLAIITAGFGLLYHWLGNDTTMAHNPAKVHKRKSGTSRKRKRE